MVDMFRLGSLAVPEYCHHKTRKFERNVVSFTTGNIVDASVAKKLGICTATAEKDPRVTESV